MEAAATGSDSTLASRTITHTTLSGYFDGDFKHDMQALLKEFRSAVDATDNARDITSVIGTFRTTGNQRRVLRVMSDAAIAQIV
jgi:hypothetical protein